MPQPRGMSCLKPRLRPHLLSFGFAAAAAFILTGSRPAVAEVHPCALFSDHMVLQQGMPIPVWGTAEPGERVVVSIGGEKQETAADAEGKWRVRLGALKPGGPLRMTLTGKNTLRIEDVLVGEVWLASGQSNMDFTVARTEKKYFAGTQNEAAEIAAANYPRIRMFTVDLKLSDTPQADVAGHWAVCSPQTVGDFSAVGYFFGRALYRSLQVPCGLIDSTWGASTAQCWTSQEALTAQPELKPLVDAYHALIQDYSPERAAARDRQALEAWQTAAAQAKADGKPAPRKPRPTRDPHQDQHNPTLLYNGMIAPVKPYAIRGAIWYQGESNGPTAGLYLQIMKTLIADWRHAWGEGDFPFLFVQIAGINAPQTQPVMARSQNAQIREAQRRTLEVPNTGMATAVDIGDVKNVHPKNKQEVGRRLALIARALVYHETIDGAPLPCSGPLYESMAIEGAAVRLRFKHTDGGLAIKGDRPTGFAIAGEDGQFVWADARVDGDTVVVSSDRVAKPVSVRYGWADNPILSLFNGAGLPASPFRTDGGRP